MPVKIKTFEANLGDLVPTSNNPRQISENNFAKNSPDKNRS